MARPGPDRFQLVGDNGYGTRLTLDSRGAISDVEIRPLPTPDGRPARKSMIDAEAMFVDPASGKSWIALEGINQIWRLDRSEERRVGTACVSTGRSRWSPDL